MKISTIKRQIQIAKDKIEILDLQISNKQIKIKFVKTKLRALTEKLCQKENKNYLV